MRKLFVIFLIIMLSVTLLTPAYAAGLSGQALLSKVVVSGVSQSTTNPDGTIHVTVMLKNLNMTPMKEVMVGVSGLSSSTLSLTNSFGPFEVDLDANGSGSVTFDLYASPDIGSGNYPLDVTLTYVNTDDTNNDGIAEYNTSSVVRNISIMIDSITTPDVTPQIIVSSYNIGKDYIYSGARFDLAFTLQNTSSNVALNNVILNFSSDGNAYTPVSGISNQLYIGDIAAGGTYTGKISLKANSSLPSGIYNINLGFQYQDTYSNPYTSSAGISIQLIGTTPVTEQITSPQIVIASYDIGSDQVFGGDEFDMTLVLKNTSSYVAENVLLDFASDGNAFISAPGVPNQLYVGQIAAGESYTAVLKMQANDTLMSAAYNLNIGLQYQDSLNNSYTAATFLTIKLEQKLNLTINRIKVPDTIVVDAKALLNVSYENPGTDDLKNLVMHISGNIADSEKTVSIGTVKAGSAGNIDQFITPQSTGSQELVISFSFEDSTGNTYTTPNSSVTLSVQLNSGATENNVTPSGATDIGTQNGAGVTFNLNQYWVYIVIAGVVLLLAAAGIVWRVLYIRKKNKPDWSKTAK